MSSSITATSMISKVSKSQPSNASRAGSGNACTRACPASIACWFAVAAAERAACSATGSPRKNPRPAGGKNRGSRSTTSRPSPGSQRDGIVFLLLQQMRGEAVPQRVPRDGLVDLGHLRRGMAGPVELARRERVDGVLPGKQPALRAPRLPPCAQQVEQVLGQHDVAILVADRK